MSEVVSREGYEALHRDYDALKQQYRQFATGVSSMDYLGNVLRRTYSSQEAMVSLLKRAAEMTGV